MLLYDSPSFSVALIRFANNRGKNETIKFQTLSFVEVEFIFLLCEITPSPIISLIIKFNASETFVSDLRFGVI